MVSGKDYPGTTPSWSKSQTEYDVVYHTYSSTTSSYSTFKVLRFPAARAPRSAVVVVLQQNPVLLSWNTLRRRHVFLYGGGRDVSLATTVVLYCTTVGGIILFQGREGGEDEESRLPRCRQNL